jgi:hypothetical protein
MRRYSAPYIIMEIKIEDMVKHYYIPQYYITFNFIMDM